MSVIKENMSFSGFGSIDAQKREIEPGGLLNAKGFSKNELLCALTRREENRHSIDEKCAREPVHNRGKHLVEVRLRAQLAAELHQGLPIVIAGAVEQPVHSLLNPFSQWISQKG